MSTTTQLLTADDLWQMSRDGQPSAKSPGRLARRANLSGALTLLHRHTSLSRADLTRMSGLNRSTTGALVAELVRLGLATEGASVDTGSIAREY